MIERKIAAIEDRLNTGLMCDGFFTYEGDSGYSGGIRLTGLAAVNWKRLNPEKWEVIFYYQNGQQIQVTLDLENFDRLTRFLN
jgi:hypothetical protein